MPKINWTSFLIGLAVGYVVLPRVLGSMAARKAA